MWITVLVIALSLTSIARGGTATTWGTVTLPPATPVPVAAPRYPLATSAEVGEAEAPAAVVYLEGASGEAAPAPARLTQQGYQFRPGILAIARGAVVEFPNLDEEYHSVFSYSKARRFDLGRYRKDEKPAAITFDVPGVVRLYCEIHDHMRGTILVLDTPYFTTTDAEGRFRLAGLPAGRFTLKAWVDEDDVRAVPVELRDGVDVRIDFPAD